MSRCIIVLVALLSACSEERVPRERGAREVGVPEAPAAASAGKVAAPVDPFSARSAETRETVRPSARPQSPVVDSRGATKSPAEAAEDARPAARRDPSEELRSRFGDPSTCFSAPDELPDSLALSISVVVSTSGLVTRASVTAPGMPEPDLRCLRGRAEGLRLPPFEDGPQTVRTTIELKRRANAKAPEGASSRKVEPSRTPSALTFP